MSDVPPRAPQRRRHQFQDLRDELADRVGEDRLEQARADAEFMWLSLELGAPNNPDENAVLRVNGHPVSAEDFLTALANVHVAVTALAAADAITKVVGDQP